MTQGLKKEPPVCQRWVVLSFFDAMPSDAILRFTKVSTSILSMRPVRVDYVSLLDQFLKIGPPVKFTNIIIRILVRQAAGSKDWVAAINEAGLQAPEAWCHPHRFGSFAPPRGMIPDGSEAQWFVDGRAAFEAVANALGSAKNEVEFPFVGLIYPWLLLTQGEF